MNKLMKLLAILITLVVVAMTIWFIISWVDIVADNFKPYPVHSQWNLFNVMLKLAR